MYFIHFGVSDIRHITARNPAREDEVTRAVDGGLHQVSERSGLGGRRGGRGGEGEGGGGAQQATAKDEEGGRRSPKDAFATGL